MSGFTLSLKDMSDEEFEAVAAQASARGKTAVYPPFIAEVLKRTAGKTQTASVEYSTINKDEKVTRGTVIVGLRAAIKRNKQASARRMFVMAGVDDSSVTIGISK